MVAFSDWMLVAIAQARTFTAERCPLCLREYNVFRRRVTCRQCNTEVCGKCLDHKVDKRNVCDGCFGLSKEYEQEVLKQQQQIAAGGLGGNSKD